MVFYRRRLTLAIYCVQDPTTHLSSQIWMAGRLRQVNLLLSWRSLLDDSVTLLGRWNSWLLLKGYAVCSMGIGQTFMTSTIWEVRCPALLCTTYLSSECVHGAGQISGSVATVALQWRVTPPIYVIKLSWGSVSVLQGLWCGDTSNYASPAPDPIVI